jgi:hypothetical protein
MDQPRALGFTLNGRDVDVGLGLAFEELRCAGGLYPCASFNRKEKLRFNFGDAPWAHPPPAGFRPYIDVVKERCAEYFAACALAGLMPATSANASASVNGSGSGADVRPFWLEDSIEEELGEESYRADTRYFLPDSAAAAASTSTTAAAVDASSTVRSSRQPNTTAVTAVAEKLQLRDEDVSQMCATHDELLGVSLELAALYARRAALLLLARWPVQRPFTLAELVAVPAAAAAAGDNNNAMITTAESMEDAASSIVRLLVLAGAESSTTGVAPPAATATTAAAAATAAATEGLALGSSGYSEVPVQQLKAALCAGGALALNAVAPAIASAVSAARTAATTGDTAGGSNSGEGLLLLDKLVACVAQQVLLAAHREYAPSASIDSSGRQSRLQSLAVAGTFDAGHHRSSSGASSSVNHRSSGFSSAAASLTEVSTTSMSLIAKRFKLIC